MPRTSVPATSKNKEQKESTRSPFTPEQLAVLNDFLPLFLQAKRTAGRKLVGFWEPMHQALFAASPLKELTDEEIAQGVDQGERKGERAAKVKKVSGTIILFYRIESLT